MALFEGKSILLIKKSPVTEHNSSKVKIFPLQHDRSTAILLFDNFSRLCFPCETSTQFPVSRIGHKETRWYTLVHRLWLYLSGNPRLLDIWAANLDHTKCSVNHQNEYGRCWVKDSLRSCKVRMIVFTGRHLGSSCCVFWSSLILHDTIAHVSIYVCIFLYIFSSVLQKIYNLLPTGQTSNQ